MLLLFGMLSGFDRSRSRSLVVSMKEMTSNGETMWIFGTNFFGTFPRREHLQQQARCIVDEWTLATFFRQTLHACDMVEEQRQFSLNGVHGFWILKDLQSMFYEVSCDVNRWNVCFGKNRFSGISFAVSLFRKDDYQGWPEKLSLCSARSLALTVAVACKSSQSYYHCCRRCANFMGMETFKRISLAFI